MHQMLVPNRSATCRTDSPLARNVPSASISPASQQRSAIDAGEFANRSEHMFAPVSDRRHSCEAGGEGFAPPFLGPKPRVLLARRPPKAVSRG